MNQLAALLGREDVLVDVAACTKYELFVQAALLFEQHAPRVPLSSVADSLLARERLASTALGHGVAVPHCRIRGLKNPLAAVIRVDQPLPFDSPDFVPVTLFVFLFVPEMATQSHLEVLGEIAEMLSNHELRERLKRERNPGAVWEALARWTPRTAAGPGT